MAQSGGGQAQPPLLGVMRNNWKTYEPVIPQPQGIQSKGEINGIEI